MSKMLPPLKTAECIKRYEANPVLDAARVPFSANLIFNAGVTKYHGRYYMAFRNDYGYENGRFAGTSIGIAESDDGIRWTARHQTLCDSKTITDPEIHRMYDPRLTVIDDIVYICFAVDTRHGIRGGIGRITGDFEGIEILSLSAPDNRNMVLFPEKIDGMYVRLERPFTVYSRGGRDRFDIWISRSPDLVYWGESRLLAGVEDVPFANDKIGPAAPPVLTDEGWLVIFHAVDIDSTRGKNGWENNWKKRYTAGVMLLDRDNPSKIRGIYDHPLIAPEEDYETDEGFRTNVIFPGAMIAENDGTVKIYYGVSDTVECLAVADCNELIKLCLNGKV